MEYMPVWNACQAPCLEKGVAAEIPERYNRLVDDARDRVRRRLAEFLKRDDAPNQAEFAESVGYKQPWASRVLKRGPRLDDLDRIAALIGCDPDDLVTKKPRDLSRHGPPGESPHAGGDDATAQAGVFTDEARRALADRIEDALGVLASAVGILRGDAAPAGSAKAARGSRRRQAR
jgi:hypothetical protein